jgi:hypothetical protein
LIGRAKTKSAHQNGDSQARGSLRHSADVFMFRLAYT